LELLKKRENCDGRDCEEEERKVMMEESCGERACNFKRGQHWKIIAIINNCYFLGKVLL
jgi:hypothetical protein